MKRIVVFVLLIALACSCVFAEAISEQVTKSYDDQYIDLQGDWNFKVYRKYDQMYQYLPYGMCNVLWEDLEAAKVPSAAVYSTWETVSGPAADYSTGGLLQMYRDTQAGYTRFAGELQDYELFPNWSEAWFCKTITVPEGFLVNDTVTLMLGVIDDVDIVYINGQPVAASGFKKADGSKAAMSDVPEVGGFNMKGDFQFEKSYWEVIREYKIDSSVLHEGENELCIRIYNNNSFGGFYDRTMALVSTREAVSYLKGLPTDALNSTAAYEAFVAKQVAALESKDIEAYKATLFDNYNENEVDKQKKLLQVLDWFAKYDSIDVADANGGFYRYNDCDVYYASRTITGTKDGESVVLFNNAEFVEYLTKDGDSVKERGNWSHCYIVSYTSTLTGMNNTTQKYGVYLPPSYYTSPEKTYPVVYLLHGINSTGDSFINVDHIEARMNEWIEAGDIVEMIVVMPNAGKSSGYADTEGGPNDSNGPWASFIYKDILKEVEQNYRAIADKRFRGISGISMGGGGVFKVGLAHPEIYTSFASHMGAVPNVADYMGTIDAATLATLDFYLDCGWQDQMVNPQNTVTAAEYLQSIGADVTWEMRDGGHNSAFYMVGMPKSMKVHSDHFVENGLLSLY